MFSFLFIESSFSFICVAVTITWLLETLIVHMNLIKGLIKWGQNKMAAILLKQNGL